MFYSIVKYYFYLLCTFYEGKYTVRTEGTRITLYYVKILFYDKTLIQMFHFLSIIHIPV